MENAILYFLLLVLGFLLNLYLDIGHKEDRFSRTLLENGLKFVPSKGNDTVMFNLSLVLLPAKVDPILEKQNHKKDALIAYGTGHIKIICILSTKVITLYV